MSVKWNIFSPYLSFSPFIYYIWFATPFHLYQTCSNLYRLLCLFSCHNCSLTAYCSSEHFVHILSLEFKSFFFVRMSELPTLSHNIRRSRKTIVCSMKNKKNCLILILIWSQYINHFLMSMITIPRVFADKVKLFQVWFHPYIPVKLILQNKKFCNFVQMHQ